MSADRLNIVHVASEFAPLVKVGGLADMVSALAGAQARAGHAVAVMIPAYRGVELPAGWTREPLGRFDVPWGLKREPASIERVREKASGVEVLLVGHEGDRRFFDRPGVYDDPDSGQGWKDNAERYLFFNRAVIAGLSHLDRACDVLHGHDHQAAWASCFVRVHDAASPRFAGTATVFTLHNMGYQGIHDAFVLGLAGIPQSAFYPTSPFEFWGRVNYMKVGIAFSDALTTVSPRYAEEIRSSEEFGCGLESLLERRRADLRGILNGIDLDVWNPATDAYLSSHYSAEDLSGKDACRTSLLEAAGFDTAAKGPVIGIVTRLAEQKGLDLLEHGAQAGFELPARLVVLGSGEPRYEAFLTRLMEANPGRVYFRRGFDEGFAHLVSAGSDMYLMPSRYEPCGLNQMYAMRYGTPPVVRATGGLADTVREFDSMTGTGTGFLFQDYDVEDMIGALRRAMAIHRQPELWRVVQRNGMARDFSWTRSAAEYDTVYREARERIAARGAPTLDSVREAT